MHDTENLNNAPCVRRGGGGTHAGTLMMEDGHRRKAGRLLGFEEIEHPNLRTKAQDSVLEKTSAHPSSDGHMAADDGLAVLWCVSRLFHRVMPTLLKQDPIHACSAEMKKTLSKREGAP